jgi:DDE superfamily endonuclease
LQAPWTHDARAFKESGAADILKEAGGGFGDKGYQGSGLVTPKKKPKGGELTMSDKDYNSQVSSFRAPIERLVGHFKNWKILHTDYRRPYSTYQDAFDAVRALFFFSITWSIIQNPDTQGSSTYKEISAEIARHAARDA